MFRVNNLDVFGFPNKKAVDFIGIDVLFTHGLWSFTSSMVIICLVIILTKQLFQLLNPLELKRTTQLS
jgi:hypothetical protein